ncbi:hypothetical protein J1N35_033854 [Gossypium stocksii]|uniref:Uncharacterized protein n=1 Tax=Gossypium stocksii TaxID=47602 RepID=A0A9D3USW6_9ROSI|nr:hypothetical protein J1N35_033854 [Gossypium stocksii]
MVSAPSVLPWLSRSVLDSTSCAVVPLCSFAGYNFINHANPVWFYGAYNNGYINLCKAWFPIMR